MARSKFTAQLGALIVVVAIAHIACGGKSPAAPSATTTAPVATRIITLSGNMAFGNIQIGQSFSATIRVENTGNSTLTITGMSGSNGITAVVKPSWTNGTIPPGGSQTVTMTFSPLLPQSYSGTIAFNGDQTGGTNTIAFSGTGSLDGLPVFSRSGSGNQVFDLPAYVNRVRILGTPTSFCQNFAVKIGGRLLVNVILGTCSVADARSYDGTHLLTSPGGTVETQISTGVNWTVSEVR